MNNSTTIKNRKTISILGCGWYGFELGKVLIQQGYNVKGSTTTVDKLEVLSAYKIQPFLINIKKDEGNYDPTFFKTDILFVCIPPKRTSTEHVDFYQKIEQIVQAANLYSVPQVVFISSIAVYGDANTDVTEISIPQPETESGKAMLKAEQLFQEQKTFTSTIIRFAGLVGPKRHPGRFFAGKTNVPNGKAPINLVHLNDCIGLSLALLENEVFGHTFNACAPDHPSKQQFYIPASINLRLPPPIFIDELINWKKVSTIYSHLLNYKYLVDNWIKWLNEDN